MHNVFLTIRIWPQFKFLYTIYMYPSQSESGHKETESLINMIYSERCSLSFYISWFFVEYQCRCRCDILLLYFVLSLKQWLLLKRTFKSLLVNPRHIHYYFFVIYATNLKIIMKIECV